MKDYYGILGVDESASMKEIKSAYRKKAKEFHPDMTNGDKTKFLLVKEAYDNLISKENSYSTIQEKKTKTSGSKEKSQGKEKNYSTREKKKTSDSGKNSGWEFWKEEKNSADDFEEFRSRIHKEHAEEFRNQSCNNQYYHDYKKSKTIEDFVLHTEKYISNLNLNGARFKYKEAKEIFGDNADKTISDKLDKMKYSILNGYFKRILEDVLRFDVNNAKFEYNKAKEFAKGDSDKDSLIILNKMEKLISELSG